MENKNSKLTTFLGHFGEFKLFVKPRDLRKETIFISILTQN